MKTIEFGIPLNIRDGMISLNDLVSCLGLSPKSRSSVKKRIGDPHLSYEVVDGNRTLMVTKQGVKELSGTLRKEEAQTRIKQLLTLLSDDVYEPPVTSLAVVEAEVFEAKVINLDEDPDSFNPHEFPNSNPMEGLDDLMVYQRQFQGLPVEFRTNGQIPVLTREQLGEKLGYKHPRLSIGKIHRNIEGGLIGHSWETDLVSGDPQKGGGRRKTWIYDLAGILKICARSNQPLAKDFSDFCCDTILKIMTHPSREEKVIDQFCDRIMAVGGRLEIYRNRAIRAETTSQIQVRETSKLRLKVSELEEENEELKKIVRHQGRKINFLEGEVERLEDELDIRSTISVVRTS